MKLLVVEDNMILNHTLCYNLRLDGYIVDSASTVVSAKGHFKEGQYEIIILDINLPDGDGFRLCREIKTIGYDASVIFLTANDLEQDMIKGFDFGADDYITKPFPVSVLRKKIALLASRSALAHQGDGYDDGILKINFSEPSAVLFDDVISFTALEYRLLKILIKNTDTCLTRNVLLEKLWDIDSNFVEEHALTSAISRIRNKLEKSGRQYIKTIYGMGYLWVGGIKNE